MDKGASLRVEDWLAAGFRLLQRQGHAGLQAAELAQELGVSVADCQAQFGDAAALRAEMLADWAARSYGGMMAQMNVAEGPAAQLRCLVVALVQPAGATEDAALRVWAREDEAVAQAVSELDARRFNVVKSLCLAAGADDPDVPMLICAAGLGYAGLTPPGQAEAGMLTLLQLAGIS